MNITRKLGDCYMLIVCRIVLGDCQIFQNIHPSVSRYGISVYDLYNIVGIHNSADIIGFISILQCQHQNF